VVSIVVLGDDDPGWRPTGHVEGQFGCEDRCTFRTVKLLDWTDLLPGLEVDPNVFCLFVAAHLEALATRQDAQTRRAAKVRLLSNLLKRGLEPADQKTWSRLIDWLLQLPEPMEHQVAAELRHQHPEGTMTYITSWERIGRAAGMKEGLKEGMEKGELVGRILVYQKVLKQPQTPREELAPLSVQELTKRAEELERRLDSEANGTPPAAAAQGS
jgi:hypothetical protein